MILTKESLQKMKVKELQNLAKQYHLFSQYGIYKKDYKTKDKLIELIELHLDKINYVLEGNCDRLDEKIQTYIDENKIPKFDYLVFKENDIYFSYKRLKRNDNETCRISIHMWWDLICRFHIMFGGGNDTYICLGFNELEFKLYKNSKILYLYGDIFHHISKVVDRDNNPVSFETVEKLKNFLIDKNNNMTIMEFEDLISL